MKPSQWVEGTRLLAELDRVTQPDWATIVGRTVGGPGGGVTFEALFDHPWRCWSRSYCEAGCGDYARTAVGLCARHHEEIIGDRATGPEGTT